MAELDFTSTNNLDFSGGQKLDFSGSQGIDFNAPAPPPVPKDNSFLRGFNNSQASLFSALESVGEATDWDYLDQMGREGRLRNWEEARQYGESPTFADAEGLGDYVSVTGSKLAELAGGLIPVAGAPVAALAAGVSAPVAAGVTLATAAAPLAVGGIQERVKEIGGEDAEMTPKSAVLAGVIALTDMIPITRLGSPLVKGQLKKLVAEEMEKTGLKDITKSAVRETLEKKLIKGGMSGQVARDVSTGAVLGAATGVLSTGITELAAYSATGVEVDEEDFMMRMKEAALTGGVTVGGLSSVSSMARNQQLKSNIKGETFDPAMQEYKQRGVVGTAVAKTWNVLTANPLANLAPKITKTETGRKLYNKIVGRSTENLEGTFREKNADFTRSLKGVEDTAIKTYRGKWKDRLMDDYANGVRNAATDKLTSHLDAIGNEGVALKLMTERNKVERYTPSMMDTDRILANAKQFEDDLNSKGFLTKLDGVVDPEQVRKIQNNQDTLKQYMSAAESGDWSALSRSFMRMEADGNIASIKDRLNADGKRRKDTDSEVMQDLLDGTKDSKGKRTGKALGSRFGNMEGHRAFDVDQSFYNKWSKGENKGQYGWEAIEEYGQKSAKRIALAKTIGKDGEILNRDLLNTQKELFDSGQQLMTGAEFGRFYDVIDAFEGNLGRIEDPLIRNISAVAKVGLTMSALPLVLLSSITEPLNIAMKTDMSTLVLATIKTMASGGMYVGRKMFLMGPSDRSKTNATQLSMAGQGLAQSSSSILTRLTDPNMNRTTAKMMETFFKLTGLTHWTQFLRNVSAEAVRMTVQEDVNFLQRETRNFSRAPMTKVGMDSAQRLKELGIDLEAAQGLAINSGKNTPQTDLIMGRAIDKFNRETVLEPSWADRPLWMSNQKMWMLSQLQGYPTMFTNTVLPMLGKQLLSDSPAAVINGLFVIGAGTFVGSLQLTLRDAVAGREPRELEETISLGMTRQFAAKPAQMVVDLFSADKYGSSAVDANLGIFVNKTNSAIREGNKLAAGTITLEEYTKNIAIMLSPLNAIRNRLTE